MATRERGLLGLLLTLACLPAPLRAHPIGPKIYDRAVLVRLTARAVVVYYRLEVDAGTAYQDVGDLISPGELAEIDEAEKLYRAYLRGMAPLIRYTLCTTLDG